MRDPLADPQPLIRRVYAYVAYRIGEGADAAHRPDTPTGDLPELSGDAHDDLAHSRLDLRTALQRLEERDRELLALRYGADLTARQIAELLELTTTAVEVALHRALARLRDGLEPAGTAPGRSGSPVRV